MNGCSIPQRCPRMAFACWEPELIWLHVLSDAVIALSYFSIPVALSIFVSKRRDLDFGFIFWAFALFIMACGFTHVLSIVTLWVPVYGIEGLIKALTALASIITAVVLWPLVPKLLLQKPLTQAMLAAKIREILDKPISANGQAAVRG